MQIFNFSKPQGVPRFYMRRTIGDLGQWEVGGLHKRYRQTLRFSITHTHKNDQWRNQVDMQIYIKFRSKRTMRNSRFMVKTDLEIGKEIAVTSYKKQWRHSVENGKNAYVSRGTIRFLSSVSRGTKTAKNPLNSGVFACFWNGFNNFWAFSL